MKRPGFELAPLGCALSPDRKGEHPQAHLATFAGALHADGYAGFDKLYEDGRIAEVACCAHARRKFYNLQVAHKSATATEALRRIQELYEIEAHVEVGRPTSGAPTSKHTRCAATGHAPVVRRTADKTLAQIKSDTSAAVRYALVRRDALMRYSEDSRYEIDNNADERALRRKTVCSSARMRVVVQPRPSMA